MLGRGMGDWGKGRWRMSSGRRGRMRGRMRGVVG